MKTLSMISLMAIFFAGCKTETSTTATNTDTTKPNIEFAYKIEHAADNWVPGDLNHVATFLNALKAFETNDIAKCVTYFGDSIVLEFDGFETKVPHDSLESVFTHSRSEYGKMTIKMEDWESVISKDKKTEYVSAWYKQIWTNNGKTDSLDVMNDARIKNGKIVSISEKTRHYAVKK